MRARRQMGVRSWKKQQWPGINRISYAKRIRLLRRTVDVVLLPCCMFKVCSGGATKVWGAPLVILVEDAPRSKRGVPPYQKPGKTHGWVFPGTSQLRTATSWLAPSNLTSCTNRSTDLCPQFVHGASISFPFSFFFCFYICSFLSKTRNDLDNY